MEKTFEVLFEQYGYLSIFIASGIDHTGIPVPLIIFSILAITFDVNIFYVSLASFLGAMSSDIIFYLFGSRILGKLNNSQHLEINNFLKKADKDILVLMGRYYPIIGRYLPAYWGIVKFDFKRFLLLSSIGNFFTVLIFCNVIFLIGNRFLVEFLIDKKNGLIISVLIFLITLTPVLMRWILQNKK